MKKSSFIILLIFALMPFNAMADKCKSFAKLRDEWIANDNCWTCEIFKQLLETFSGIANESFDALASPLIKVLAVFTALWLLMQTLFAFVSLKGGDPIGYISQILKQLFKVIIIIAILEQGSSFLFNYCFSPIFIGGMEFAKQAFGGDCTYEYNPVTTGAFPPDLIELFLCLIKQVSDTVADTMAISESLLCNAKDLNFGNDTFTLPLPIIIHPGMFIQGIVLWLLAFILSVSASIKLLDGVFKMGFLGVMIPILAVAWVFDITRKYVMKGVNVIIYSVVLFICILLMLNLGNLIISLALTTGDMPTIITYFDNPNYVDKNFGLFSIDFVRFLISYVIVYLLLDKAREIASSFASEDKDVAEKLTIEMIRNLRTQWALTKNVASKMGKGVWGVGKAGKGALGRVLSK